MEITQRQAEMCGALSDFHRILILYALAERAYNVSELAAYVGVPQPTVSRHLKTLRDCGIVFCERNGKSVYYALVDVRIIQTLDLLRTVITEQMKNNGITADKAAIRPAF